MGSATISHVWHPSCHCREASEAPWSCPISQLPHRLPGRAGPGSADWQKREHRPRGGAARVLAPHRLQPDFERMAADRADAGPQPAGAARFAAGGGGSRHTQSFQSRRRTMTLGGRRAVGELGLLALFVGLLALLVASTAIGGAAREAFQGPGRGRGGRARARRDPAGRPGDGGGRGGAARAGGDQVAEDRRRAARRAASSCAPLAADPASGTSRATRWCGR